MCMVQQKLKLPGDGLLSKRFLRYISLSSIFCNMCVGQVKVKVKKSLWHIISIYCKVQCLGNWMPFKPCRKKALIKVPYNLLQMVSVHVSYRPSRQILEDKSQFEKHRRVSQTVAIASKIASLYPGTQELRAFKTDRQLHSIKVTSVEYDV